MQSRPHASVGNSTELLLQTERLHLFPLGADAIDALVNGDARRLGSLTGARFPTPAGPPPYMAESLPIVRDRLRTHPEESVWWNWLVVRQDSREVVGSVAFGGMPDVRGAVLIGYAMYPDRVGSGFATEAVRAMVEWAFAQPGVNIVRALAPVWNTPAVHVAEQAGMRPVASDEDDEIGEVLVYEVARE
jgi:[ribosomal protein S5]-alanine N-acetyltransferase